MGDSGSSSLAWCLGGRVLSVGGVFLFFLFFLFLLLNM